MLEARGPAAAVILSVLDVNTVGIVSAVPVLNDRNPGSVTRLLAESFAREFAVLSRQLESVYQAGFLSTATGRDLDQVVALVGELGQGRVDRSRAGRIGTGEALLHGLDQVVAMARLFTDEREKQ